MATDSDALTPDRLTKAIRLAKEAVSLMEGVSLFENTGLLLELLAERTEKPKLEFCGRRWICTTTLNGKMFCGSSNDGPLYAIEDLLKELPK